MALGRTVGELEQTISSTELQEWIEYYNLEPFGVDRNEIQLASLSYMLASFMGNTKAKTTDFMPSHHEKPKQKTISELAKQVFAIFGEKT